MVFRRGYLGRRIARLAVSLAALVTIAFMLIHLIPGDPVRAALGIFAPQELVEARRHALGLDQPLLQQYANYVQGLAQGDLGTSLALRQPVAEVIAQRLPGTLTLALLSLIVVVIVGVGVGLAIAAGTWKGDRRGADVAFNAISGVVVAMPEFVSATALTGAFAVVLAWFPVAGKAGAASYVLPILALAAAPTAALARVVRVEGLRVLSEDYMRTARAKRLSRLRTYLLHALPNCLTATLTVSGLILSSLVAGTVLVENVFAWSGLGSVIVLAITSKDYALTQGVILVLGSMVLAINFAVDILISLIDPRSDLAET